MPMRESQILFRPGNQSIVENKSIALIVGSAPGAVHVGQFPKSDNLSIVTINNAWRTRPDWDYLIHPGDFPEDRKPPKIGPRQQVISHENYVPAQNEFGGFVYAGGTMAFTAGYWALHALKPRVLAYFACDMVYSGANTHFYGQGTPDPLRDDVTLRSLEAKSARLMVLAAQNGCACVNLSTEPQSRLVFPKVSFADLLQLPGIQRFDRASADAALAMERKLDYLVEDGEYWHRIDQFDADALARIDEKWLRANAGSRSKSAAA